MAASSVVGRSHARAMLVEGSRQGTLHAVVVRIRAKRGHQIVAVARKLTVLCWHLLTRGEDYNWSEPGRWVTE